jgi:hypothetical protein
MPSQKLFLALFEKSKSKCAKVKTGNLYRDRILGHQFNKRLELHDIHDIHSLFYWRILKKTSRLFVEF